MDSAFSNSLVSASSSLTSSAMAAARSRTSSSGLNIGLPEASLKNEVAIPQCPLNGIQDQLKESTLIPSFSRMVFILASMEDRSVSNRDLF
jgi:hypothetical protein